MLRKTERYFKNFLRDAEEDFAADTCGDRWVWFSKKIREDWNEESLLIACRSYLFAVINTEKAQHKNIFDCLEEQELSNESESIFYIMEQIRCILDAEDTKESDMHAKAGVSNLLWYLYGRKALHHKKIMRYILDEGCTPPTLHGFYVSVLQLFISILRHDFPYVENASLRSQGENSAISDVKEKKLTPHAAAMIARLMRHEHIYVPSLSYAKFSLRIKDPLARMEAFNNYAFCALSLNEYQLVYDIFYSWIHQKMAGELQNVPLVYSDKELKWRKEHSTEQSIIYGNMAYICLLISRMLPQDDKRINKFREAAMIYIKDALSMMPNNDVLISNYAEILYDEGKLDDSLQALKNCEQNTTRITRKLVAKQRGICIQIEKLCAGDGWAQECKTNKPINAVNKKEMQSILSDIAVWEYTYDKHPYKTYYDRQGSFSLGNGFAEIQNVADNLDFQNSNDNDYARNLITCILLSIYNTAYLVRQQLRCRNYKKRCFYLRDNDDCVETDESAVPGERIAYYTSLDNLQYLLNKVYCDTDSDRPIPLSNYKKEHEKDTDLLKQADRDSKNCFTMMHAYYMNDPNEGLTLLSELSEEITGHADVPNLIFRGLPPVIFREHLYDSQFVFLKSFTNVIDQLNMWSMYASDRNEGSDSNGCCICIAPETFEMMVEDRSDSNELEQQSNKTKDDYQLYEVAYVQNGEIEGYNDRLKNYYRKLKELFVLLNRSIFTYKLKSNKDMESIQSILQKSLAQIVFLFKDASYRAEQERRIVITRSKTELERISQTHQNPPKLFINPYHQVYVEQLILGPKAKTPDHWIPYLQYELTKMWESWPKAQYGERKPVVRKSSIHYRD